MGLTLAAIRRPVFISMFVLSLVITGFLAYKQMPRESSPDVDFPFVTIVTVYAGAGPQEMETLVSQPLEEAVAGVNGLKHITSTSRDGLSVIGMEFELGTNLDAASADVRDKVSGARNNLPKEAMEPAISRVNITGGPIMSIGVSGNLPSVEMRHLADTKIKDAFSKVPGAAAVYVDGGDTREIQVRVDKSRLQAYGMSLGQVVSAINSQNLNIPGGSVKETGREYAVRMIGEFTSPKQLEDIQIQVPSRQMGGKSTIVRLSDVATVKDTVAEPDRVTRLGIRDGKPEAAVVIAVQKQSGGNTLAVAVGVKREMAALLGKVYDEATDQLRDYNPKMGGAPPVRILPDGVNMTIATDDSRYVKDSLDDVTKALLEGILLVVLIVFFFLHSGRATFIVALAIPTSIFATYLPLHALGYSLNFMTLLGLSLAVGILVDDSIVVLENIERHLRKGEEPAEAAVNGRSEIGLAAIAITLVDVVVFIPIANMGGIVGQFFRPFGWSVAIATLFSLFMSFTLTPMLASRLFQKGHGTEENKRGRVGFWGRVFNKFDAFYDALDRVYENLLAWTLDNRALTIWIGWATLFAVLSILFAPIKFAAGAIQPKIVVAAIVVLFLAIGAALSRDRKVAVFTGVLISLPIGFEFMPNVDRGLFGVTVEGPAGLSLQRTDKIVQQVAASIRDLKDPKTKKPIIAYAISTTGATSSGASQGSGDAGSQYGNVNVKLVEKIDRTEPVDEVMRRVTALTASISGAKIEVKQTSNMGGGKPVSEEVTGPDMAQNVRVADALAAKMKGIKGLIDVDTSWKVGKPELQIVVDQKKAADLGLSAIQIGAAARTAIQGSGDTGSDTKFREGGDEYDIRVQYAKLDRNSEDEVRNLVVANVNGKPIYLNAVADVALQNAPNEIKRKDRQRLITVDANAAAGFQQGNLQNEVDKIVPAVYTGSSRITTGGIGAMMAESMGYMFSALALSVVLVYMLMAALFESLTTPLVIWLALPQALVGALLGLMVSNKTFGIVSMIGIIMLMGLVTKNAILLIDYTNTLRARGKSRRDAILEAGPTRLRPVMMTTFAMIGGMMPTALAVSQGSEQRQPMAIVVISGLILSTILTLLVIPVTYTLMDDLVTGTRSRWLSVLGRRSQDIPVAATQPAGGE